MGLYLQDILARIPIFPSFPETRGAHFKHAPVRDNFLDVPHDGVPYPRKARGVR